jgi:hypothetical protein
LHFASIKEVNHPVDTGGVRPAVPVDGLMAISGRDHATAIFHDAFDQEPMRGVQVLRFIHEDV